MKKKVLKIGTLVILVLSISFLSLFLLQTFLLKRSLTNKWLTADETEFKGYEFVRCNWNIFEPEVAFVDDYILLGDIKGLEIHFYTQKNLFDFSRESWSNANWIGGTDVKNTTFPELVKIVKEDCGQFQEGHGDYYGKDLAWSYSPAPSQEELDSRHIKSVRSDYEDYSEETAAVFDRIYSTDSAEIFYDDEKALGIYNRIQKEGLHPDVQAQIDLEKEEYQRMVESGEIVPLTLEERLRKSKTSEDKIKIILEAEGLKYIGPQ